MEGRIPDGVLHYKCEEDGVRLDAIGVPGFWAKVMYPKLGAWLSPQHVNIIFNTPELDEDGCATGDIHTEMITLEQEYLQRQYNITLTEPFTIVEDAKEHPLYQQLIANKNSYFPCHGRYNKILILNINNLMPLRMRCV